MLKSLPDRIAPWQLAHASQVVRGRIPLVRLPRLTQELLDGREEIEIELRFGHEEANHRCYAYGHAKARLNLACQRCLQPMEWSIDIQLRVELTVTESGISQWPEGYEPWVVEWGETASLWDLVEDELLLALPIAPCHPLDGCPEGEVFKRGGMSSGRYQNPFSVLKKIKIKGENGG